MTTNIITFNITNDPWINNGIILFTQMVSNLSSILKPLEVNSHQISLKFDETLDRNYIAEIIFKQIGIPLINKIFTLTTPVKIINRKFESTINKITDKNGFIKIDESINFTDEQSQFLQEKNIKNDKNSEIVRVRFNFLGLKKEFNKLQTEFKNDFVKILDQENISKNSKICVICSSPYFKGDKLRQVIVPFLSGHHNLNIRGISGSTYDLEGCPKCVLMGKLSLLDSNLIFTRIGKGKNKITYIFLPIFTDFKLLNHFKNNLSNRIGLYDWDDPEWEYYNTNVKNIQNIDPRNILLTIYCRIVNNWSPEIKNMVLNSFFDDFIKISPIESVKRELTNWAVIEVNKGQIVSIKGKIYHINWFVFDLVKKFSFQKRITPYKSTESAEIAYETNETSICELISKIKSPEVLKIPEKIANAIIFNDFRALVNVFFESYKQNKKNIRYPITGFIEYLIYYLKVKNVELKEDKIKAIRTLSFTIASALYRDVGLISKLYNATSRPELKNVLSEMLFRLYKNTIKEESQSISPDKYERLLNLIESENWKEIQSLLVAFVCIYSINKMNKEDIKKNE